MIRSFSFGGGVQSTAALVLAAQGRLPSNEGLFDWDVFMFANVGEQAENPATLVYVEQVAKPFAAQHGVRLVEVRKVRRGGAPDDLYDRILRNERSLPFPVRMDNGAPGTRSCTAEFKVRVIAKALKAMGASEATPALVGMGISADEIQRARHWGKRDPREPSQILHYPLLTLGIRRQDAMRIIADAGLPPAPRSACWFCPFHSMDEWRKLRREHQELFDRAVELERTLNERRAMLGRESVWLTRHARPIDQVVQDQLVLTGAGIDGECDSGWCFT